MGIGPWATADLIRDVERRERSRFKRALSREKAALEALLERTEGHITRSGVEDVFRRIRSKIEPKPREKVFKGV